MLFRKFSVIKQFIAVIIVLLNLNIFYKIIQREVKWHRAYNRIWPVLLNQRVLNSKIPSLKEMKSLEAKDVARAKHPEYSNG